MNAEQANRIARAITDAYNRSGVLPDESELEEAILFVSRESPVPEQPKSDGALGGWDKKTQEHYEQLEAEFGRFKVSTATLRASHDELLDSFKYVMAEWDSDVRSTQCFDSRIITRCRLAIKKAEVLGKDKNFEEKEPQSDLRQMEINNEHLLSEQTLATLRRWLSSTYRLRQGGHSCGDRFGNSETSTASSATRQMAQYVPGPWQVAYWLGTINNGTHQALAVWPADIVEPFRGDPICLVSNIETQDAQDEANANLIAAAPELLGVCKKMQKDLSEQHTIKIVCGMLLEQLCAAIAKAEGKSL